MFKLKNPLNNTVALFSLAATGAKLVPQILKAIRRIDLEDRVVVITGGSRGLGLEIARVVAAQGGKLVLIARDEAELNRAKTELKDLCPELVVLQADMTDKKQVDDVISGTIKNLGRIDVLINNAGLIQVGPMDTMLQDDYEETMKIHFWAPFYATQAVIPSMKANKFGRIVNVSSIAGLMSVPHLLPYSASKHALAGYSEGLRSELLQHNIFVTTVCPGLMRTGSHVNAKFKGQNKKEYLLFTLADAMPFLSIDSRAAAQSIVEALRNGDARLVITVQAKMLETLHSLFPEMYSEVMGMASKFLPKGDGGEQPAVKGKYSKGDTPPALTVLADNASQKNNEVA